MKMNFEEKGEEAVVMIKLLRVVMAVNSLLYRAGRKHHVTLRECGGTYAQEAV